jgi:F-type H+-transporting ATPase subunit gamma
LASLQDIRRRIKTVKNIQQITKAMKMVAAARLRRAQESAVANRPYADKMRQVLSDVAASAGEVSHPLLEVRQDGRRVYVVLASDKGLAGAYSSNVFKEAVAQVGAKDSAELITVGRKTREYFKNRNYKLLEAYEGISERPTFADARRIAGKIIDLFTKAECDEVYIIYTRFISAINVIPTTIKLLPFTGVEGEEEKSASGEYIYEPSAGEVLGYLLPQYIETMVYAALLQAAASELGARMTAMSSATDNAETLISKLVLNYNKVRQAGITREITEIVSGAEALK